MTLVATWVRKNGTLRELIVVSDSRLSGGESWDACPKVVPLPRPATVIAMSGDATEAYAFLLQAINTCNLLDGHVSGRTDIAYLAKKLRDVFADSRAHVTDLPVGESKASLPVLDVVLLGWSWRRSRYEGFSFRYDEVGKLRMNFLSELDEQRAYGVYLFGDAAKGARGRLSSLLRERGRPLPRRGDPQARAIARAAYLDWEPLEVLLEKIADSNERTVGGVPQICRIYQYGEAESFVWRAEDGHFHFGGRQIQATERFDRRVLELVDRQAQVSFSPASISAAQASSTDNLDTVDDLGTAEADVLISSDDEVA